MKPKAKKYSQSALLNFIVTCRTASEGILDVSDDHLEYGPKELSHESLNAFGNTFLLKTNFKASFINLDTIRSVKESNLRDAIQSNFQGAYERLYSVVKEANESWVDVLEKKVASIILSVSSEIILQDKLFFSEELKTRFHDKFLKELAEKLETLMKLDVMKRDSFAKDCAAWIEYRMICADKFLSETWINCNAASLLLSSWVLELFDCDLPIYLNVSDYFFNLPLNNPQIEIDEQFKNKYLKRFNVHEHFQPFHFPRKLKTDIWKLESLEESPWSYYRSVILDNMHILSKGTSVGSEVRKDAAHYSVLIEVVNLIPSAVAELGTIGQTEVPSQKIREIIEKLIAPIHDVEAKDLPKKLQFSGGQIPPSYFEFYNFLADRILNYKTYDIIETLAVIDFKVSLQHKFFQDGNSRTAQAIVLFVCAYFNMAAPEIVEGDDKKLFLNSQSTDFDDDGVLRFWYKYYTTLFELPEEKAGEGYQVRGNTIRYENHKWILDQSNIHYTFENHSKIFPLEADYKKVFADHVERIVSHRTDLTKLPRFYVVLLIGSLVEKGYFELARKERYFDNGWNVRWEDVIEKDATIYKEGIRPPHEINLLKKATGYDLKQLVVFKPKRIVLHKFIVYLVTHHK